MFHIIAVVAVAQVQAPAPVDETTPAQLAVAFTTEAEFVEQLWEDGYHLRFGTRTQGPVHLWRPRTYRRESAQLIVYLHGFYVDVDRAMLEYQLPTQFRDSARNALFIVPQTRSWRTDPVLWPDLQELLTTVEVRTRLSRPAGAITVVAHSGGYRTVVEWLPSGLIHRVVLVDGLYGNLDDFARWVDGGPKPRQLVLVGFETQPQTELFLIGRGTAVRLDDLPYLFDELPARARAAELLYFQSERFDHMALVTSGRLLPWLLRALR